MPRGDITAAHAALANAPRCGRGTKGGDPCGNLAGFKTVHPGQGACFLHGGLQEGDGRLKHGRYSIKLGGIRHKTIGDLYENFLTDPDPTGLFDEIALLRALIVNFINEYHETTEALLAWYAQRQGVPRDLPHGLLGALERSVELWARNLKATDDWTPELERQKESVEALFRLMRDNEGTPRPKKVMDISDASVLIERLGGMVDRVETLRAKNAVSEAELNRVINQMGRVVDVLLADEELKVKIREGWLGIVTR